MAAELAKLEAAFEEVRDMQAAVREQYAAMLAYFGENLNSMPSGAVAGAVPYAGRLAEWQGCRAACGWRQACVRRQCSVWGSMPSGAAGARQCLVEWLV